MGNWFGLGCVILIVSMEMLRLIRRAWTDAQIRGYSACMQCLRLFGCLKNSFRSGLFYPICDGNIQEFQHRLRIHMQTEDTALRVKNPLPAEEIETSEEPAWSELKHHVCKAVT